MVERKGKFWSTCTKWNVTRVVILFVKIAHYLQNLVTINLLNLDPKTGPAKTVFKSYFHLIISLMMMYLVVVRLSYIMTVTFLISNICNRKYLTLLILMMRQAIYLALLSIPIVAIIMNADIPGKWTATVIVKIFFNHFLSKTFIAILYDASQPLKN